MLASVPASAKLNEERRYSSFRRTGMRFQISINANVAARTPMTTATASQMPSRPMTAPITAKTTMTSGRMTGAQDP
jgi:hypothetical protein